MDWAGLALGLALLLGVLVVVVAANIRNRRRKKIDELNFLMRVSDNDHRSVDRQTDRKTKP